MTDIQEVPAGMVQLPAGSELLERGRYAIYQTPDGAWSILRASGICETCQGCGCGEQHEAIPVPAMMVPFITGQAEITKGGMLGMIKGLFNGQ